MTKKRWSIAGVTVGGVELVTYVSSFIDLFRLVDQPLRDHPYVVGLRDEYVGEMATLRRHADLS